MTGKSALTGAPLTAISNGFLAAIGESARAFFQGRFQGWLARRSVSCVGPLNPMTLWAYPSFQSPPVQGWAMPARVPEMIGRGPGVPTLTLGSLSGPKTVSPEHQTSLVRVLDSLTFDDLRPGIKRQIQNSSVPTLTLGSLSGPKTVSPEHQTSLVCVLDSLTFDDLRPGIKRQRTTY